MNERELFLSALELNDPAARQAHLQTACADDAEMLARVKALIAWHESPSRFLITPAMEQMVTGGDETSDAVRLFATGSTRDDDCEAAAFDTGRHDSMICPRDEPGGIFPADFLHSPARPGSLGRLGHYEVYELLGRGAFGIVLMAFDEQLHRPVAIKVLAPEMAAAWPVRSRFLREARTTARIRHENVVSIYAVEDDRIPYIVMEYVPGQTLQARLDEQGPLPVTDVLRLGRQIAEGLAAAHTQGLIHRDVKPRNILLETAKHDHVKITDFGLARAADDASITQSGMIAGTPMYMAPEQAQGQKLDPRADLFSLGSVLYQMLTGRPPFHAPTTLAVLKRVVEEMPRPISDIVPETPEWMCRLVGHLHAKNPDDRYASAREVADLFTRCAADLNEGRTPEIPPLPQAGAAVCDKPVKDLAPSVRRVSHRVRAAMAISLLLTACLGITEATGVTQLGATVVRVVFGSGTLVVETDDPDIRVLIDDGAVTVRGAGVEELTLRPGDHTVVALKNGRQFKRELVSITRNGRTIVRISLEDAAAVGSPAVAGSRGGDVRPGSSVSDNTAKIWSESPYNGFTDLIRFKGRWYCSLREGAGHAAGAGSIRILVSEDAKDWRSAAVLQAENLDYRDGELSVTPDNRLMLNGAAAVPATRDPLTDHYSFVSFSDDGGNWSAPQRILSSWEWLWRAAWHRGCAYGVAYRWDPAARPREYRAALYRSSDGLHYEEVCQFDLVNASEAAVAFDGDTMLCLQRRDGQPNTTMLGSSEPPYTHWHWHDLGCHIAGPDLVRDPHGNWWAAGRIAREGGRTAIFQLDANAGKLGVAEILPSSGDTGYPGLVWHQGELWVSYFSTHQGKPSVYLAHGVSNR